MEMWVRALMCEHSIDLALAARVQTARAGADSKLRLNLGHWDSLEQRQAGTQVTAERVQGVGSSGEEGEEEEGGVIARAGEYLLTYE